MKSWKKHLINGYIRMVRALKGVEKKVVFTSFGGATYSDNPRAVSEALHEIMPDAKIIWLFNDPQKKKQIVPQYVQCVNRNDFAQSYSQLATAAVYVTNFSFSHFPKSKKQLMIQTWHGDKAFKKVLYDSPFASGDDHVAEAKPGFCDYAVAGSEYGKNQYRSAFRYTGTVLMEGTPRNDRLIVADEKQISSIRDQLGVADDVKIMLYAPTLRRAAAGKSEQQIQDVDIPALLTLLEKRDNSKWICLLRAHPAVKGLCGAADDSRIKDASSHEDMADLLLVADMLITDYSSCAGDFALRGRPVVLFQPDRKEYLEKDRTFYFDIEDSPYFVAENQKELEDILQNMTEEKARENCKAILQFYGDKETGRASECVAQIIKNWIEK